MAVQVYKAPERPEETLEDATVIFLAGSIEMGKAEDWQSTITKHLEDNTPEEKNIIIYNPRRDDWDSSWKQSIDDPKFKEQVTWELDNIDICDIVIIYFDKDTKAPITLLELGKISELDKKALVCCPEGFWRKGNVEIVCDRKGIPLLSTKEELIKALDKELSMNKEGKRYSKEYPFEVTEEEDTTLLGALMSLNGNPTISVEMGTEDIIYVKEYDYIDNACHMGTVRLLDRDLITGICTEGDVSKIRLLVRVNEEVLSKEFRLVRIEENQEEKIVINT